MSLRIKCLLTLLYRYDVHKFLVNNNPAYPVSKISMPMNNRVVTFNDNTLTLPKKT